MAAEHPEKAAVTQRIAQDVLARLTVILELGLGYLTLDHSTPILSPGEFQRLRLATQVRSNLFGVVYVLDEPSAGLHPADTEALLVALGKLRASGNSLFVVEHELDVIRRADWIVDVGPAAGENGGTILYSGPPKGLLKIAASETRRHLFAKKASQIHRQPRRPAEWLKLQGITRNNLHQLDAAFPLGVFTTVTGISGSGKSSLVSQALVELVAGHLGHEVPPDEDEGEELERVTHSPVGGIVAAGMEHIRRLVRVDQKALAARHDRTSLPIPVSSTTSASSLRRPNWLAAGTMEQAAFLSMSPKADAKPAKARDSSSSSCCSYRGSIRRVPPATGLATTRKP